MTGPRKALLLAVTASAVLAVAFLPLVTVLQLSTAFFAVAGGLWLIACAVYGLQHEGRVCLSWWRQAPPMRHLEFLERLERLDWPDCAGRRPKGGRWPA